MASRLTPGLLLVVTALLASGADADRDGLDDAWEQQLLEHFAPRLILSKGECDQRPARFAPDEPAPRPLDRDGTLYAKVTPWTGEPGAWVEIHYYHLWANDCGRMGHPLDVERVSVLLKGPALHTPPSEWRAVYWFAAGHEGTVCDASHGATAQFLEAETHGATVFVSLGKHASYLAQKRCKWGCGGDRCPPQKHALEPPRLINVGEADHPLNGSLWINSPAWPMKQKLATDFHPAVVARLAGRDKARINGGIVPLQSVVLGGEHTLRGLETAGQHTDKSLQKAAEATGASIKKSLKATGRFLGLVK